MPFQIKARAVLLTYNGLTCSFKSFVTNFKEAHEKDDDKVTYAWEKAKEHHFHIFYERSTQIDCDSSVFAYDGVHPNCQCNSTKGSGFRPSADRGHFYLACLHKNSYRAHDSNYEPLHHYAVKPKWILDMWKQSKIDDDKVLDCLAFYKCLTPNDQRMVEACVDRNAHAERMEAIAQHMEEAMANFEPFPVVDEVERWYAQYESCLCRYKFLILWGPSQTRKSAFIADRLQKSHCFYHNDTISWAGFDDLLHDTVVFDDVKSIYKFVSDNRLCFQANGMVTVNTSATNCYARRINMLKKKIVICTNLQPTSDWILANSYILEVPTPLRVG